MTVSRLAPEFLARPIAHRGLHDAARGIIENSIPAIEAACDHGFGIEIDIQPTGDGTPLVFHDYDLSRLTGASNFVREMPLAEVRKVTLSGSNDGVPTLADVLDMVDGRVPLLVEIKDQDMRLGPSVGPLEQAVATTLEGYGGPVAVMSFNPHSVAAFAAAAPQTAVGLVTDAFGAEDWPMVPLARRKELVEIQGVEGVPLDFISHDRGNLSSPRVAEMKAAGLPILCWTVRSEAEAAEARRVADQITFEGYMPQT